MANALLEVMQAIVIILAIFGVIYMLSDAMLGITIILVCGLLIFVKAFLEKSLR